MDAHVVKNDVCVVDVLFSEVETTEDVLLFVLMDPLCV